MHKQQLLSAAGNCRPKGVVACEGLRRLSRNSRWHTQAINAAVQINIFNISKINTEVRGGKAPRIKRLSEYLGQSYFDYLASLPDARAFCARMNLIEDSASQRRAVADWFNRIPGDGQ